VVADIATTGGEDETLTGWTAISAPGSSHAVAPCRTRCARAGGKTKPRFREEFLHLGMRAAVDQVL